MTGRYYNMDRQKRKNTVMETKMCLNDPLVVNGIDRVVPNGDCIIDEENV